MLLACGVDQSGDCAVPCESGSVLWQSGRVDLVLAGSCRAVWALAQHAWRREAEQGGAVHAAVMFSTSRIADA